MYLKINNLTCAIILLFAFIALASYSENQKILFSEGFNDLSNWEPFYFPKIKKHTSYTIVSDGVNSYLKAESNASASATVYKKTFSVYEFPGVRWRWKVENVYKKGNAKVKSGDDYPIRVYIMFKYDPKKAGFSERLKYRLAKMLYGKYPPHSSLNYIWTNKVHKEDIITSTYTDRSKMIMLEKGRENVGKWIDEEINIIKDYKRAFGKAPPAIASIAIMNDSDNTKEKSISYIDFIEVFK